MFKICLFDLDETLLRTDDLEEIRLAGKGNSSEAYVRKLQAALAIGPARHVYTRALLNRIRVKFPELKLGVFTRSPRSYATTVLTWAYPGFLWDTIIAYEDVEQTKPRGEGIDKAMNQFGMLSNEMLPHTILVGDGDVDVRAAYHCGCVVALDKSNWPRQRVNEHWRALEHVPDAIIDKPEHLLDVLSDVGPYLPELERTLTSSNKIPGVPPRFDKLNHFIPRTAGGDTTAYPIHVAGRSFSNYDSVKFRKVWHTLTASIEDNKESQNFPEEWINAVRSFIQSQFQVLFGPPKIVVSTIPHRPTRTPRLENFLIQLETSLNQNPLPCQNVICVKDLLAYKPEVRSQHGDYLNREERFINVRDNLHVKNTSHIQKGVSFVIIDDVVTTGASLIYAHKYLKAAGASDVKCLSMAKNVGNLFK